MRLELQALEKAISTMELPSNFDETFCSIWSSSEGRFHSQETYILDFKETIPSKFSEGYGAGIVRLALAFYNSYGGFIVFGVQDRTFTIAGIDEPFDIEAFNATLSSASDIRVECLSKRYTVNDRGISKEICVVLVPKRAHERPARLVRPLGAYREGIVWLRDRHEVLEARVHNIPMLYSSLRDIPSAQNTPTFPIHRSFPPSPATMKEFVGRSDLVEKLWDWFVFGDQPRIYLHGPGGSGKSTLAFEFAQLLAEQGNQVQTNSADRLDYVIYISGKDSELNPYTGKEQSFLYRQFETEQEQFAQILYHSGQIDDVSNIASFADLKKGLTGLFDNYNGLIVLDDIDALSRKKVPTGEETLFVTALRANRKTKILYTLRYPPSHALDTSISVPGLNPETELAPFLTSCCGQFSVPLPKGKSLTDLQTQTGGLPLLIETIIGLRKFTSSYEEAIAMFRDQGGEEARKYLYQREYDRLDNAGKSRATLAVLGLLKEPIGFTTLTGILGVSREQVRDALVECSSIFLSSFEDENEGTLYQLAPPSVPFVIGTSERLNYYESVKRKVEHFSFGKIKESPEEAQIRLQLERLVRMRKFPEVTFIGDQISSDDPSYGNPRIQSLLGQAYAELGEDFREKARIAFKIALGVQYCDIHMMRSWYYLESRSGYGHEEAARICQSVLTDQRFGDRHRSEFLSKLGSCFFEQAKPTIGVNHKKGLSLLRQSINAYLDALYEGEKTGNYNQNDTLNWLEKPLSQFVQSIPTRVDEPFILIDSVIERKHDVHMAGVSAILMALTRWKIPAAPNSRAHVKGLCERTVNKAKKAAKPPSDYPGFGFLIESLEAFKEKL